MNGSEEAICPAGHAVTGSASERKSARGPSPAVGVEQMDGVWQVGSYAAARKVLRDAGATRQAGFNSEMMMGLRMRPPVLFQDGQPHKEQRVAIARFFTPKRVEEQYRGLIERLTGELLRSIEKERRVDLAKGTLTLAVQVAAQVVGIADSRKPGLERRLETLLSLERFERVSGPRRLLDMLRSHAGLLNFYLNDVRPAMAARRKDPKGDVISHLLESGYSPAEIVIECVTYGAAGMATTREFICMAAWHLLENEKLRQEYLAADEATGRRILYEILRLEPVVGRLYRRTSEPLTLPDGEEEVTIPAGALVALDIRAANADRSEVGERPLQLCPHRELATGVQPPVLSFGDGAHRCPGAFIAIEESDIFLRRLLSLPLTVEKTPTLEWNDLIEGYELRDFMVRLD